MTLQRRGFLGAILMAGAAPAIVKASSLMKIIAPSREIILLSSFNRGVETELGGWNSKLLARQTNQHVLSSKHLVGCYAPNFVKPEIAFDLSDTMPAVGKWDYVNVGPNVMSLEKW